MAQIYLTVYEQTRKMISNYAKENPELMTAISKMHQLGGSKNVALKSKYKKIIALYISINSRYEGCITIHIYDAIDSSATYAEIVETIGTAIFMGEGLSVVRGSKVFAALQEFESM